MLSLHVSGADMSGKNFSSRVYYLYDKLIVCTICVSVLGYVYTKFICHTLQDSPFNFLLYDLVNKYFGKHI